MPVLYDIIYGKMDLPDWLDPFIRLPEFVRLRGVRLSNVDSIQFKDLSSPTRWEHGIGAAWLAIRCARRKILPPGKAHELILAALLHDISTGPFAHTSEYVVENFDHEFETANVLSGDSSVGAIGAGLAFCSSLPRFVQECKLLSKNKGISVDPEEVARMVMGEGELGFLISGTIDIDNIDNVLRGCIYMGMDVDKKLPLLLLDWLSERNSCPTGIANIDNSYVIKWLDFRHQYYKCFYSADDQEIGRQAFLQHIMRRALDAGLSRKTLIKSTDEYLLDQISTIDDNSGKERISLFELVNRYRLLEPVTKFLHVDIESKDSLRILSTPHACRWIEENLTTKGIEPFVIVQKRRYPIDAGDGLFPPAEGALMAFKLGGMPSFEGIPEFLRHETSRRIGSTQLLQEVSKSYGSMLPAIEVEKPWLGLSSRRKDRVVYSLNNIGDWSFRLSRNESFHPYPSTFVHAIPSTLINCLGIQGELVIDPFGGIGTTAVEATRLGCSAISSDINIIATLISKARLSYLTMDERQYIRNISLSFILNSDPISTPIFDRIDKWHHPKTIIELTQLVGFINAQNNENIRTFLTASLSAILPLTTGRRGREHAYFADNTPLPRGKTIPEYQDACGLFLIRLAKNIELIERYYSTIERDGRVPSEECARARIFKCDAKQIASTLGDIVAHSAAAVITSPPYLCMTDYTLGQRLSYAWLYPESLAHDLSLEIGNRRGRFTPDIALSNYLTDMDIFAANCKQVLRPGGFLCVVLGAPEAKSFSGSAILEKVFKLFQANGFQQVWSRERPIHWHRHGFQRSKAETVAVFELV